MPTSPTYNYYIKKKADANYPTTPTETGTTDTSYIFAGLDQNTAYTIKVTTTDKAGNAGEGKLGETEEIKTGTVAGAGEGLATGVLTASAPSWNAGTHKATITLTTTTDYQIQWQKGGINGTWKTEPAGTKTTTVPDLEHNDMVYARLYDGKNAGNEASVKVEDGDDPEDATITGLPTEAITEGDKITATVAQVDNQSGVKIADCKWKFTTSQSKLGTEATSYTGDMSGSFTSENQSIECTASTAGTYWLHVLTVDNAGNAVETVSGTSVTVKAAISASDIANDDEVFKKVAGGVVTNYEDGQDIEWKVFYADEKGIYLIASDYVLVSKLTSQQSTLGFTDNGLYNIYWSSGSSLKVKSIDSTVASRFMLNQLSTFANTTNNNYKMTACLMDATKWNTFRDQRWVNENDIIGSPTLEMWIASWNKKYKNVDGELFCNNAKSNGYYVGTTSNPTSYYIINSVMSAKQGYKDTLYYPHTSEWNSCFGYWLASPSANSNYSEMYVSYLGRMDGDNYNINGYGVRPVVHLKSGVKLKEVSGGYELIYDPEKITDLEEGKVYYAD